MDQGQVDVETDEAVELQRVYRAHLSRVHGYLLYRLGGRRGIAEELTQEVFLAYVAAVRRGNKIDDPQGWLITVARNKFIAHLRKASRKPEKLSGPPSIDDIAQSDAERSAMDMLEQLPPGQRTAMTLRYIDDLTVAEVALVMGRSTQAAESLLARARRTLKEGEQ